MAPILRGAGTRPRPGPPWAGVPGTPQGSVVLTLALAIELAADLAARMPVRVHVRVRDARAERAHELVELAGRDALGRGAPGHVRGGPRAGHGRGLARCGLRARRRAGRAV